MPQFLMEAGYGCREYPDRAGLIGVTQPRRVAATASAHRVASELNTPLGSLVGYQASIAPVSLLQVGSNLSVGCQRFSTSVGKNLVIINPGSPSSACNRNWISLQSVVPAGCSSDCVLLVASSAMPAHRSWLACLEWRQTRSCLCC